MSCEDVTKNKIELTNQNKAIALFQFIRELNKLKHKVILNVEDYPWYFPLLSLPDDSNNIRVFYRDRVDEDVEGEKETDILLSVHKPEYKKCPEADDVFKNWLIPGWDDYNQEVKVKSYKERNLSSEKTIHTLLDLTSVENEETIIENFSDDVDRVEKYDKWIQLRNEWVEEQRLIERTRNLFARLYSIYFELQRDSETKEIIVANGMLRDAKNPDIYHPVLTHRVKIEYDADSDVVSILDTNNPSELYSEVFQVMDDINLSGINSLQENLREKDYHPLDRNETPDFLKILVRQLSSSSLFSDKPYTFDENKHNRISLYLSPCLIVRNRLDGTLKAVERIVENIQQTGDVPKPICDIVSGGIIDMPEEYEEPTIEERLAAIGGESVEILLSKEANKEQLDIAKRIEQCNAVLVQGPPGTGKTHTIANLMGHFLAHGKSVLVTSFTKKALRVLKEKVVPGLQDLCVSMLDDTNVDMERSVDGITSYMSKTTSHELKRDIDNLSSERQDIIKKLASVRKKLYAIICQECNNLVLDGEEFSPSKAAAFVAEHEQDLNFIPGDVRLNTPLPLDYEQLTALYRSNEVMTSDVEKELATKLPTADSLLSPEKFSTVCEQIRNGTEQIEWIQENNSWKVKDNVAKGMISFSGDFGEFSIPYPELKKVEDLKQYSASIGNVDEWMKSVAVDGRKGGAYRQQWLTLIERISNTCHCADEFVILSLGKKLMFTESTSFSEIKSAFTEMQSIFESRGKISKITLKLHKQYEQALSSVTINGKKSSSVEDCALVLKCIELHEARQNCCAVWNELLVPNEVPPFDELNQDAPEREAENWIKPIKKYLDWYNVEYELLLNKITALKIPKDILFQSNMLDSDLTKTKKIFACLECVIPQICDACNVILSVDAYRKELNSQRRILTSGKRGQSSVCQALIKSVQERDPLGYAESYATLEKLNEKYAIQDMRNEALKILEPVAPQWAEAIRTRQGVHGECSIPRNIRDAWKWKQLCGIIKDIEKEPFAKLQSESLLLSREYRDITAKYAEKSGWYHLLRRTEMNIDMKQSLEGWRSTVKKIGKGTGKSAPMLKAKAREKMAECQNAVPCWIMPINKALESLDPRRNKFDVIIIDEASQADISSLSILYMGKKLIVVGDDQQVSPMAVGVETDKIESLQTQYIKDKIPNYHLYTATTSIYDIAKTTFQPLMLREHFRCVPDIIGFSNMLSYNGKIMPLRDEGSSELVPAVVNYRVTDGERIDKTNPKEAESIVALMQACFEQPEYDGKSFGVISLLGDEQVKLIQQKIERRLKPQDVVNRNILCGNPANFQGDERDVIFLSLVDSRTGDGPLRKTEFGKDDSVRKRYNVAASRARDQLWVVDSLDSANDLKDGDIRKKLIEYSKNPKAIEASHLQIKEKSESPFELSVATALVDRGYHIEQQWKVGSYRLDIVVICDKKKIAIECDGERWHSGDEKIREDMERQTILERLGWRFIRIRGSEFYRNREKTLERVISSLSAHGIEPETINKCDTKEQESELLSRIKMRAHNILCEEGVIDSIQERETISAALNPRVMILENDVTKSKDSVLQAIEGINDNMISNPKQDSGQLGEQINMFTIRHNENSVSPIPSRNQESKKLYRKRKKSPTSTKKTSVEQPVKPHSANSAIADSSSQLACDTFLDELSTHGMEVIDNRTTSKIVWVLFSKENREFFDQIISKYNYNAKLEKRGSIATGNRPAWRVMV